MISSGNIRPSKNSQLPKSDVFLFYSCTLPLSSSPLISLINIDNSQLIISNVFHIIQNWHRYEPNVFHLRLENIPYIVALEKLAISRFISWYKWGTYTNYPPGIYKLVELGHRGIKGKLAWFSRGIGQINYGADLDSKIGCSRPAWKLAGLRAWGLWPFSNK